LAARRLIAVMLVLLFLSSLAAALAPVEPPEETTSTTTESLPGPAAGRGALLRETIDAAARRPRTIEVHTGDQLQLRVTAERPGTIEIVGLGADEDVDPLAPAFFDVLLDRAGRFPVRELESRS
jgi:hypothetical protein